MWNEPSADDLACLPPLYHQQNRSWRNIEIHQHYFIGGCDWYAAEYEPKERLFFGYAILHQDLQKSEWGYFSLDEMREVRVKGIEVDRDLHWAVRPASDIEKIVAAHRARGID